MRNFAKILVDLAAKLVELSVLNLTRQDLRSVESEMIGMTPRAVHQTSTLLAVAIEPIVRVDSLELLQLVLATFSTYEPTPSLALARRHHLLAILGCRVHEVLWLAQLPLQEGPGQLIIMLLNQIINLQLQKTLTLPVGHTSNHAPRIINSVTLVG